MTLGARFSAASLVPAKPAYTTRPKRPTPSAPHAPATHAGSAINRRSRGCCRRGVGHSVASATKETTSTTAAAQPNSQPGTGRSARPTRPCAHAAAGRPPAGSSAHAAASAAAPPRRGLNGVPASRFDLQRGDLFAACLELDHDYARDRRREVEADRDARGDVLVQAIAVDVHLFGGVRRDLEAHAIAFLDGDRPDPPRRLAATHEDVRTGGAVVLVV